MSTDSTSETKLFIHYRIISLHPNGLDLTTAFTFSTSIAFVMVNPGDKIGGGDSMLETVLSNPLEKPATAPTTVADKTCLIQDIVSNVNQPKILSFLKRVE